MILRSLKGEVPPAHIKWLALSLCVACLVMPFDPSPVCSSTARFRLSKASGGLCKLGKAPLSVAVLLMYRHEGIWAGLVGSWMVCFTCWNLAEGNGLLLAVGSQPYGRRLWFVHATLKTFDLLYEAQYRCDGKAE